MVRGKNTSFDLIQLVIFHHVQGKSVRNISQLLNIKKSTVNDCIQRYKKDNRISLKGSTGRPRTLNIHEERRVIRKIKKDPKLSAPRITQEVFEETSKKVNPETIRRVLRKQGYNGRVARKKPFINDRNRKRRLKFALEYRLKDESWWNDVIFCDESKFNIFGSDGRQMIWRKKNEELKSYNLLPTVKHGGGSVMVWGCISTAGVGELVFIESIMNAEVYLKILQTSLLKSAETMGIKSRFKFYQDNDPKHKARIVQTWLSRKKNCPNLLEPPAQSPDLNPIEHLWERLDHAVHKTPVTSKAELKTRLQEEWGKFEPDYLKKIINNMPKRLEAVMKQKGYPTKY